MQKRFYAVIVLLCAMTIIACGSNTPGKIEAVKAPAPTPESSAPSAETPSSDADAMPADAASPEDLPAFPATVAAYLNAAEILWKSDQEHVDYRVAFGNDSLDQRQEIEPEKDYDCKIALAEDFAETGNFSLSLSVDGTAGNLYMLEGDKAHASIVFGGAYRLGDTLYPGTGLSDTPPFALNLETKVLTDCQKEYKTLQKLYKDYLQGQPELSMEISGLTPLTGTLTIYNTGEKTIGYGESYLPEKSMGGIWYPVSLMAPSDNAEHSWTDIMYTLETGDEATLTLRWDLFYPNLPAGSYRIIKSFSYPEDAGGKENFYVAAYFEME